MPHDELLDFWRDISRFRPVMLEPFLKLRDLTAALHLDVEFDVLCEPWPREVARTYERLSSHDVKLRVRDVRLRVELLPIIDTALDLLRPQCLNYRRHSRQKWILLLLLFKAAVEGNDG